MQAPIEVSKPGFYKINRKKNPFYKYSPGKPKVFCIVASKYPGRQNTNLIILFVDILFCRLYLKRFIRISFCSKCWWDWFCLGDHESNNGLMIKNNKKIGITISTKFMRKIKYTSRIDKTQLKEEKKQKIQTMNNLSPKFPKKIISRQNICRPSLKGIAYLHQTKLRDKCE